MFIKVVMMPAKDDKKTTEALINMNEVIAIFPVNGGGAELTFSKELTLRTVDSFEEISAQVIAN